MDDKLEEIRQQKHDELMNEGESPDVSGEIQSKPVHIEDPEQVDELVEQYDIVLVDFYADWCGPCKILEPTIESVANATDAVVAKVNIDQHQRLAQQNQVRGVPTLQLYVGGDPVKQLVGVQDEATLTNLIEQFA